MDKNISFACWHTQFHVFTRYPLLSSPLSPLPSPACLSLPLPPSSSCSLSLYIRLPLLRSLLILLTFIQEFCTQKKGIQLADLTTSTHRRRTSFLSLWYFFFFFLFFLFFSFIYFLHSLTLVLPPLSPLAHLHHPFLCRSLSLLPPPSLLRPSSLPPSLPSSLFSDKNELVVVDCCVNQEE